MLFYHASLSFSKLLTHIFLILCSYLFSFSFLLAQLFLFFCSVVAQIFNPIAELVIPIVTPSKKAKAEIEIPLVIVETKIRKCSI